MNNAGLYANNNNVQKRDAEQILEKYCDLMNWPENCDVLDIGCGIGDVTTEILFPALKSCRKLIGADMSTTMIEFAQKNYKHHNLSFHCLNIETMNGLLPKQVFPNGFHKIFSFYCFHWIMDQRKALKNVYDLLQPNGEILLLFLANHPVFFVYDKLAETKTWSPYMKDVSKFVGPYHNTNTPSGEMKRHLQDIGFLINVCECIVKKFTYPSFAHLKGLVESVNPFIDRLPITLKQDFVNECTSELAKLSEMNADGSITVSYSLIVVFANKNSTA